LPQIRGYRILAELGRGQAGTVYKALRLNGHSQVVALKLLRPADSSQRQRFEREIEVQKSLDCPGIVRCLDSGSVNGSLYYAMEFVDGVPLDEYLSAPTTTLRQKLATFQSLCAAVGRAHTRGVAHRDLKPGNILVDAEGKPHILDFGICAVESDEWSTWLHHTQTRPGDILGTIKYMAPEQAWGGLVGPVDHRADIWSLGIILYEIATGGRYPYSLEPTLERPASESLLHRIRHERPEAPQIPSGPYTSNLKRLIEACLLHEPERRIQSAARLAADVRRLLDGQRVRAASPPLYYRVKRIGVGLAVFNRPSLWALITVVLVVSLMLAAFIYAVMWRVEGFDFSPGRHGYGTTTEPPHASPEVVIIAVGDSTAEAVVRFAESAGISGIAHDLRTWRALHGRLMQRLAVARPQAVVWDYFFRTVQPGDTDFVAGVRGLNAVAVPVVLAADRYSDGGDPVLSPDILAPLENVVHHGLILARDMSGPLDRPGEFVMALRRGQRVIPSLALAAVGAVDFPDCRLDIDWSGRERDHQGSAAGLRELVFGRNNGLSLKYRRARNSYLGIVDHIGMTTVLANPRAQWGAQAGDLLACKAFELLEPAIWKERTIAYEAALVASDDELRGRLAGRLVIIGDVRSPHPQERRDLHRVQYVGQTVDNVPGCYMLADAIRGLLANRYLVSARPVSLLMLLILCVAALAGCLLPIPLVRTRIASPVSVRGLMLALALAMGAACFLCIDRARSFTGVHAALAGMALSIGVLASCVIEHVRNRYRVTSSAQQPQA
jgi:predicted Ser/Thr protein kinase